MGRDRRGETIHRAFCRDDCRTDFLIPAPFIPAPWDQLLSSRWQQQQEDAPSGAATRCIFTSDRKSSASAIARDPASAGATGMRIA